MITTVQSKVNSFAAWELYKIQSHYNAIARYLREM